MSDGSCPACGRNTNDVPETSRDQVLIGIYSSQPLPEVCHVCGIFTRNFRRFSVAAEPPDDDIAPGIGRFLVHFFIRPLAVIQYMERQGKTVELRLLLPTCPTCAKGQAEIKPHYIDFDAHRIDLVVHVNFKKALQAEP